MWLASWRPLWQLTSRHQQQQQQHRRATDGRSAGDQLTRDRASTGGLMERSRAALIATTPVRVSERAPEPGRARPVPARPGAATRGRKRLVAGKHWHGLGRDSLLDCRIDSTVIWKYSLLMLKSGNEKTSDSSGHFHTNPLSLCQTGEFYIWDVKILFSFLFQYKRYHRSQICTKLPAFRGHWPGPATGPVLWTPLSDFFLHAPDEPSPSSNYRPTVCLHLTIVYKFSSTSCNKILPYGDETCPCLFRPLSEPRMGLTSSMRLSISVL